MVAIINAVIGPATQSSYCWLKKMSRSVTTNAEFDKSDLVMPVSTSQQDIAKLLFQPIQFSQTRLLCLQPGSFAEPLICTIHEADLIQYEGVAFT